MRHSCQVSVNSSRRSSSTCSTNANLRFDSYLCGVLPLLTSYHSCSLVVCPRSMCTYISFLSFTISSSNGRPIIATTGPSTPITEATKSTMKSSNGSGNAFAHGLRSANLAFCNSPPAPRESQSTVSRIYREAMGLDDSRSKRAVIRLSCQRVIPASIACVFFSLFLHVKWLRRHTFP